MDSRARAVLSRDALTYSVFPVVQVISESPVRGFLAGLSTNVLPPRPKYLQGTSISWQRPCTAKSFAPVQLARLTRFRHINAAYHGTLHVHIGYKYS